MKLMMKLIVAICAQAMVMGLVAEAAKKPTKTTAKTSSARLTPSADSKGPRDNLSRDIRFGDSAVYGKYQYANEGTAEVENEKTLDDLLGVRTDFKDRLKLETQRH